MAAKEKGKIVSASPDSPTLEKLSTFSQQIRSALHCFSAVATRTNALWQRQINRTSYIENCESQPARMRCGKGKQLGRKDRGNRRNPHECAVAKIRRVACKTDAAVATRTNALWQRLQHYSSHRQCHVATRTNALWQRSESFNFFLSHSVATRTNALWQRCPSLIDVPITASQPARMRCGKAVTLAAIPYIARRNPHECAVAKNL